MKVRKLEAVEKTGLDHKSIMRKDEPQKKQGSSVLIRKVALWAAIATSFSPTVSKAQFGGPAPSPSPARIACVDNTYFMSYYNQQESSVETGFTILRLAQNLNPASFPLMPTLYLEEVIPNSGKPTTKVGLAKRFLLPFKFNLDVGYLTPALNSSIGRIDFISGRFGATLSNGPITFDFNRLSSGKTDPERFSIAFKLPTNQTLDIDYGDKGYYGAHDAARIGLIDAQNILNQKVNLHGLYIQPGLLLRKEASAGWDMRIMFPIKHGRSTWKLGADFYENATTNNKTTFAVWINPVISR